MDSARDFYLLGESVPQVRVSTRTLALRGFLPFVFYTDSLLPVDLISLVWHHGFGASTI